MALASLHLTHALPLPCLRRRGVPHALWCAVEAWLARWLDYAARLRNPLLNEARCDVRKAPNPLRARNFWRRLGQGPTVLTSPNGSAGSPRPASARPRAAPPASFTRSCRRWAPSRARQVRGALDPPALTLTLGSRRACCAPCCCTCRRALRAAARSLWGACEDAAVVASGRLSLRRRQVPAQPLINGTAAQPLTRDSLHCTAEPTRAPMQQCFAARCNAHTAGTAQPHAAANPGARASLAR